MNPKVPPQDRNAEESVLGSLLMDQEAITKVAEFLRPEHFYAPANGEIFGCMLELYENRKPIDVVTLANILKKKRRLTKVGGAAYLADLVAAVPTARHVEEYGKIVRDAWVRRSLIKACGEISEMAFDEASKLDNVLDQSEQKLFSISEESLERDFLHVSKLLEEVYERAEELDRKKDKLRGIPTGFKALDNILGGLQGSDLIILAARPSVGKTAMVLDIARHIAVKEKKKVGIFSLEMSNMQLMDRLVSMQLGVDLWNWRMGKLKDEDFERWADIAGMLSESDLFIDDTPGMHIMEMRTKARRLKAEHDLELIVVDYLQLMRGRNQENRVQEVSEISMFLKNLARELDIPVIAVSQLSRAVEQRTTRIPQLSDLRESGSIEQDADVVVFLHREEQYNPETDRKGIADVIVAKHRNGPTGVFEMYFVKEQARFRDIEKYREKER